MAFNIRINQRYARTSITPLAIKSCADKIDCGVCYWRDSGRIIFSNACMNDICLSLTGEPLLNGNTFQEAMPDEILKTGDRIWHITGRDTVLDGRPLHEMVAWDITEIQTKTEALRRSNEEVLKLNQELRDYNLRIDEVVRKQEILRARVNIHDEMNRLMLYTTAADAEDREEMSRVFEKWKENALLLCMEEGGKSDRNGRNGLNQLAESLNIRLIWCGDIPDSLTDKQRDLFFLAARETTVNAVKHAAAETVEIHFEEDDLKLYCRIENDGSLPFEDIKFTGGLANLDRLAKDLGAEISVTCVNKFVLTLSFEK